jgi:pyochelin synthetase
MEIMSVVALVGELENLGVRLFEQAGSLRFRAPKGVMTEARLTRLRADKEAILAILRQAPGESAWVAEPEARHRPFPLTDVQAAYVLGRRSSFSYGGVGCHAYGELQFRELDPKRLEHAFRILVARHDMLRAVSDDAGSQRILEQVPPYTILVKDMRTQSAAEGEQSLLATRALLDHALYAPDRWPLFDLRVTQLAERSILHFSLDFLLADYVSIQILLGELAELYAEPNRALPAIEIAFRDYVIAERRLRSGHRFESDRAYWWNRIDSLPPRPDLPTLALAEDAPARFSRRAFELEPVQWRGFRDRSASHGLTPSAALAAAYAEVIGRFSQSPRFTLNVTLQNRYPLHPHVGRLVGDFTAVNLLGLEQDAALTFAERAARVGAQLFEDLDHRLCSGVEVLRELARRRGAPNALMPIVFTSAVGLAQEAEAASGAGFGELTYGISQTPQVWIDCQVMERKGALGVNWDFRDGIFPAGLVEAMFGEFERFVRTLARGEGWDAVSPVALPPEQAARRRAVNEVYAPLSDDLLHTGFLTQVKRAPERVALIAGAETLSYGQLYARAAALAGELGRTPGFSPGSLVGVVIDKGAEQIAAVLGVLLAGGAYLPIDTTQPPARRNEILVDARAVQVFARSTLEGNLPAGVTLLAVDRISGGEPASSSSVMVDPAASDPGAVAYVIYTSGSTGKPKGVMISHRAALNTCVDINARFAVGSGDRGLGIASLGFDLSVYDIFGLLGVGAGLVLPDPERRGDPSHWAELVATHGVTLWNSVPAQMQMLHDYLASAGGPSIASLRLVLLSGDWIPVTLPAQVEAHAPAAEVISLGGATEVSIWSIFYPIEAVPAAARSIPYGRPLTNQKFDVLDSALRSCPEWVRGELYIGGAGLALGYFGDAAKTAERFIRHPVTGERLYRTGDMGRYLPDGNIEFLGREDAQVKIRGHRIELSEVEAALQRHPGVAGAGVIVDGERPLERRLVAFLEPEYSALAQSAAEQRGDALLSSMHAAERRAGQRIAREPVVAFGRKLDEAALLAMLATFRAQGLFATSADAHRLEEIVARTGTIDKHERLVRRWLAALVRHGYLAHHPAYGYHQAPPVDSSTVAAAWAALLAQGNEFGQREELLGYFRVASQHLSELLQGQIDPVQLLFPEGRLDIQESAYAGNQLSDYLNHLVASAVASIASDHTGLTPLRVLEIGAGVGGTSVAVLPALDRFAPDYLFTDVSQFFLNKAAEKFARFPWVRYGLFDLNVEPGAQGFGANSFDVIVCANVLHYSRNAATVLERIRGLLRPGGYLVFIETTRDNYQILTSMEFLFDARAGEFEDVRRGKDATFVNLEQWRTLLAESGADATLLLPDPSDVLAEIGMFVFVARYKSERVPLDEAAVAASLREQLPAYMLPAEIHLVDALPLTANAKLDRKALRAPKKGASLQAASAGSEPQTELERKLAILWCEVLRLPRVPRDQGFFELGGDSLVAAQVAGLIREKLPDAAARFYDALLRQILGGPTLAELAAWLEATADAPAAEAAAPESQSSPLLELGPALEGPAVCVLVHDGSGGLSAYAPLVEALSGRVSLLGLAVVDPDAWSAEQAEGGVQRLATAYARVLRERGSYRYHLVGYHGGALLATEIARQLAESGSAVAGLSVISSYPLPCLVSDELFSEYLFVLGRGGDPLQLGYPSEADVGLGLARILDETPEEVVAGAFDALASEASLAHVGRAFRERRALPVAERRAALAASLHLEPRALERALAIFCHGQRCVTLHRTWPYAGDLTLLRNAEPTPIWPTLREEMRGFWERICVGDVNVEEIPGNHFDCLTSARAGAIAESILRRSGQGGAP